MNNAFLWLLIGFAIGSQVGIFIGVGLVMFATSTGQAVERLLRKWFGLDEGES